MKHHHCVHAYEHTAEGRRLLVCRCICMLLHWMLQSMCIASARLTVPELASHPVHPK